MVRKRAENGTYYHEPPYTEEEEMEIYRRMDGPITILHAPTNPVRPSQPQKNAAPTTGKIAPDPAAFRRRFCCVLFKSTIFSNVGERGK
jgi:hypothetical protein